MRLPVFLKMVTDRAPFNCGFISSPLGTPDLMGAVAGQYPGPTDGLYFHRRAKGPSWVIDPVLNGAKSRPLILLVGHRGRWMVFRPLARGRRRWWPNLGLLVLLAVNIGLFLSLVGEAPSPLPSAHPGEVLELVPPTPYTSALDTGWLAELSVAHEIVIHQLAVDGSSFYIKASGPAIEQFFSQLQQQPGVRNCLWSVKSGGETGPHVEIEGEYSRDQS